MKNKYRKFQCNRFILTKDIMSQSSIHLYEMTELRKMAAKSKNVVYFDKTSYNINISNLSATRTIRIIFFIICISYYDFFFLFLNFLGQQAQHFWPYHYQISRKSLYQIHIIDVIIRTFHDVIIALQIHKLFFIVDREKTNSTIYFSFLWDIVEPSYIPFSCFLAKNGKVHGFDKECYRVNIRKV